MSGLNGVAHVILTAGDFARSTAFWRAMIAHLELKVVLDSEHMLYGVGGRTAIGIRTGSLENAGKRFDQGAPGLHHACFRMRDRAAVDAVHGFLARRDDIRRQRPRALHTHTAAVHRFRIGQHRVEFIDCSA